MKTLRPGAEPTAPAPIPAAPTVQVPENFGYRLKNKLLGPPLDTSMLAHERLGIPTALAVFSSDCISSSAYATEQILTQLIPYIGLAAFSLVVPITGALLVVLFFLILSYRETIKEYPTAGGAYMVTRDNFGLLPAQVAGVALLTDYILTVSVSTAAGTDALTSAFPSLAPYHLWIAIGFVGLIAFGNLRGVRESGKLFALPTYFFIVNMGILLAVGAYRWFTGGIAQQSLNHPGAIHVGHASGSGLLYGAAVFVALRAFASGGAAVTGVEAISNGVTAFRRPEWKNARTTLIIMGVTLGIMFLGISILSVKVHPVPYVGGTPTVISQVAKAVFGTGPIGHLLYLLLQAGTVLILVLAANTSFADFPRLASFHAGDNFMPRQLTKRGHRLVFSNGIISLSVCSTILLLATDAQVDKLIPLYAIGVFTSFSMSQAGMAKHHITRKEPGWRRGLFVNGMGALLSAIVDVIIAITKFKPHNEFLGSWAILVLVPLMVWGLVRLNRQYESEAEELAEDAPHAAEAPTLRRHEVIVLVDQLDVSAARAIQYARTLHPDALRAVHFDLDPVRSEDLQAAWTRLGLSRLSLEVTECPDRRLDRCATEMVAEAVADGETEVTLLLPRRVYTRGWHRLLHDGSAERIAAMASQLPHANVTFVPYHLGSDPRQRQTALAVARNASSRRRPVNGKAGHEVDGSHAPSPSVHDAAVAARVAGLGDVAGTVPIASVVWREPARVAGRVRSVRVQPWSGVPSLEATIVDGTGGLIIVFLGRRQVAGIQPGARLIVEGMVGEHRGRLAMLNPTYELLPEAEHELPPSSH